LTKCIVGVDEHLGERGGGASVAGLLFRRHWSQSGALRCTRGSGTADGKRRFSEVRGFMTHIPENIVRVRVRHRLTLFILCPAACIRIPYLRPPRHVPTENRRFKCSSGDNCGAALRTFYASLTV
jgi:hypothetical protein